MRKLNFPPRYNIKYWPRSVRGFLWSTIPLDRQSRRSVKRSGRRRRKGDEYVSRSTATKTVIIDEIKEKLERAQSAVVIDYIGTTVAEADAMRKKLREANVDYTVYKNTLVKRAIAGTQYEELAPGSRRTFGIRA